MEQNRKETYIKPLLTKHEQLVDITGTMSGKNPYGHHGPKHHGRPRHFNGKQR